MSRGDAIRAIAHFENPDLFKRTTSGMSKHQRSPIDKARAAALLQATAKYDSMPKQERDYWRKK